MMAEVNRLYRAGDVAALHALDEADDIAEGLGATSTVDVLRARIEEVRGELATVRSEIARLLASPLEQWRGVCATRRPRGATC
jgi:hypothetical protein